MTDRPPVDFDETRRALMGRLEKTGGLRKSFKTPREYGSENKRLKDLSEADELTGLFNRRRFEKELESGIDRFKRYRESFSLINLDLRQFKDINDKFGHGEGDKALRMFADFLTQNIRDVDYAFRAGGDEFILLLPKTGYEKSEEIMHRLGTGLEKYKKDTNKENPAAGLINMNYSVKEWSSDDTKEKFLAALDKKMFEQKRGK